MASAHSSRDCFVVSPIGEPGTEHFERFRRVLDELIRPAVESSSLGLRVVRADEIHRPGSFIRDVLEYLASAHTVIVDLTGQNANVFYELGVRHALSPRTILIARGATDIPADLREYRTLIYGDTREADATFRERLRKYFEEIERTPEEPDNPVLSWLKPPRIPDDLRQSFAARLASAGGRQSEILRFIQAQTRRPGATVSQGQLEGQFKQGGPEMYYRLEQLRLLGFITKEAPTASGEYVYGLSADYRRELGYPEIVAQLALVSGKGTTLPFGEGPEAPPAHFFYVRVKNLRESRIRGQIVLTRIQTFAADGTALDDYRTRLQLKWRSRNDRCAARVIDARAEATANLGFIIRGHGFFQLDVCADPWPEGFPGRLDAHQRMRVGLLAEVDASHEPEEVAVEISWNGRWSDDAGEMRTHLVVQQATAP